MVKIQEIVWDALYGKGLTWKKTTLNLKEVMEDKHVLELGVGNGKTLRSILEQNPKEVIAIDISKEAIKKSKATIKSKRVKFVRRDIFETELNKKFDVIVCYYFLNNFKKLERILIVKKINQLLKKKGIILFEDFARGDLRQKGKVVEINTIQKQNGLIFHFFEKDEILELFKGHDIKVEEKTFNPIRKDKSIKRKIIKATIRTR